MPKLSQLSTITTISSADKFVLVKGSGGSSSDVLIAYSDLVTQLGLEVIPQENKYVITSIDSPFTVPDAVCTVFADSTDGAITINLKAASLANKVTVIRKNTGANDVTLSSADNINGATTYALTTQYDRVVVKSDADEYFVLSE